MTDLNEEQIRSLVEEARKKHVAMMNGDCEWCELGVTWPCAEIQLANTVEQLLFQWDLIKRDRDLWQSVAHVESTHVEERDAKLAELIEEVDAFEVVDPDDQAIWQEITKDLR